MRCEETQELITAFIDGELAASERRALEDHLAECSGCKLQREREAALKQSLKQAAETILTPLLLREAISEKIGTSAADRPRRVWIRYRDWLTLPSLHPIVAFASIVMALAAVLYQFNARNDGLAGDALAVYRDIAAGKALARVNDAAKLRTDLSLAVQNRFAPVPLDLSALRLYPVAGFAHKISGRDVLVTVYEGSGPLVICFTFLGNDSDAPKDAAALFDPERQVNFYSFSRGAVNGVMHRVGEVHCLLVAKMPATDLLAAARGKAHHA
jgi:anti-sigma factor RsiW